MPDVKSFFLLPEKLHQQYELAGISVLPIDFTVFDGRDIEKAMNNVDPTAIRVDYQMYVQKINSAFEMSKADIVIDDNELFSTLIAEKNGVPRISIYRTGFFRNIEQKLRTPAHMHSMEKTSMGRGFDASMILKPKRRLSQLQRRVLMNSHLGSDADYFMNYLNPTTKLIPGIPSIENLPDGIENKDSFFYTGPLLVEDNPSEKLGIELNEFFTRNYYRKTVFITTGLVDQDDIQEMVLYLLKNGYAVISTRKVKDSGHYDGQLFTNAFLSLNYICSKVDLVIHQCGSGMYHYPLLHQKPAITIGTQCYDREDVALRLQQLKLSRHVPSERDDEHYMEIFIDHVKAFERGALADTSALQKIKEEIYRTMMDFDMAEVMDYTLNASAK